MERANGAEEWNGAGGAPEKITERGEKLWQRGMIICVAARKECPTP